MSANERERPLHRLAHTHAVSITSCDDSSLNRGRGERNWYALRTIKSNVFDDCMSYSLYFVSTHHRRALSPPPLPSPPFLPAFPFALQLLSFSFCSNIFIFILFLNEFASFACTKINRAIFVRKRDNSPLHTEYTAHTHDECTLSRRDKSVLCCFTSASSRRLRWKSLLTQMIFSLAIVHRAACECCAIVRSVRW